MSIRTVPILCLALLGGCAYHVAEQTDRIVADMSRHQFDREPPEAAKPASASKQKTEKPDESKEVAKVPTDVETANFLNQAPPPPSGDPKKLGLEVPLELPGSEVPPIRQLKDKVAMQKQLDDLYRNLTPLQPEPKELPGPSGRPYTLADFQDLAVQNSPFLKQAASDVKAAQGQLVQARTMPNPYVAYGFQPSNDGETAGVNGIYFDQKIPFAGKLKLSTAAAQKSLDNAEVALRKARSDLSTQVRQAYFSLLVSKEIVRVNKAVAILTDNIYRYQAGLLRKGGFAASYEPASLRAQAYQARVNYKTAITTYIYNWAGLVTACGVRTLPLSEVSGRIDAHIPFFEYGTVLNHVLTKHTDIISARNGIEMYRYQRKLAQMAPFSDVDFNIYVGKETALPPFQWFAQAQFGFTLPIWDQNRGNIMSAEAALVRAQEQVHAAEQNLATNLQNAYTNYKNALDSLEDYRRFILPDLVRAYRGVLERRRDDPNAQFGDLVAAQQSLTSGVSSYLTILGQVWTSSIQIADYLQTDDLFQLANPKAIEPIPDLQQLPCCHPGQGMPDGIDPANCGPRVQPKPSIPGLLPRPMVLPKLSDISLPFMEDRP